MDKHTYVIGDIHGEAEQLKMLLQKMDLKAEDEMYVLGDVVDRGKYPMEALQILMSLPNCTCLAGNHEVMVLSSLKLMLNEITEDFLNRLSAEQLENLEDWMRLNGGGTTALEFTFLSQEKRKEVLEFMENFALYAKLEINGQSYVLVHGGLGNFEKEKPLDAYTLDELVWTRADYSVPYYQDKIVVTGHTPTQLIPGSDRRGYIYQKNNHIALDCGACFSEGRLAGICLETGECFYAR